MTIDLEQIKINYKLEGEENGEASPLIWLTHGAGGDMNHFNTVTPILVSSGYRVLLMDVRYHGLSQPTTDGVVSFKFSDVIQDMTTILKEVKATYYSSHGDAVSLFMGGFSMGGMVALLFSAAAAAAATEPTWLQGFELKGVIAMASGIPFMEIERPGWDIYRDRSATSEILQLTKASIIESALTDKGKKETERAIKLISDPALYECLVEIATYFPPPSDPPRPYVPGTYLPMLLVWPDHDAYTKQEMEKLHAINLEKGIKSKFVTIENAGHMVVLDKGEEVAAQIVEFCKTAAL